MLVLELLGTLCMRDETRPVPLSAQQKKLSGLLAILAVAGKQGLSRDRIEAYLWPESTGGNARHSLDQAVYSVRNALGIDVIISTGRDLRLNPELVRVDVWEFEEAIRAGQQATAASIYRGPLLDGVHFADSRELESWIDTNRNRLRFEYQTVIERLAKVSADGGDHGQSVTWLRQLVNSDRLSSDATKKLMLALAAAGNRAAAVKQARLYQELVKQELEIEPDSEIEGLAASLSRPATAEAAVPSVRSRAPEGQPRHTDNGGVTAGNPSTTTTTAWSHEAGKESRRRNRRLVYAVFALAILISGAAVWGSMRPAESKQVVRYTLVVDSTEAIAALASWSGRLAISPDGTRLAYIGGPGQQLLIRPRNELHAAAVSGTQGVSTPFFSPDGQHVGFLTEGHIQIASIDGGPPITVCDSLTGVAGASWGRDGFIYADGRGYVSLLRVEARPRAMPKWFTTLDTARGEINHSWPDVLPNGKGVLFSVRFNRKDGPNDQPSYAIAVADIPSGAHRVIVNDARYSRYAASGHLLYVTTQKALMVVPFDQNSMKVTGEPRVLSEGMRVGVFGSTDLAVSRTGTLLYATGRGQGKQELVWVTRDGKTQSVDPDWEGDFWAPALSPDGKRLAVARRLDGPTVDIWIKQLDRGPSIKLTSEECSAGSPTWTPDGGSVTFSACTAGSVGLWTRRSDGSAREVLQFHEKRDIFDPVWSADRKWLIYATDKSAPDSGDIAGIRPGIDTAPVPVVVTEFREVAPALSPDGRWLAYTSNESGQHEIYVVPFPNTGAAKWAVSTSGGTDPQWSHGGRELFYRDGMENLVAVEVKTNPTFSLGRATRLFSTAGFGTAGGIKRFAVSSDDRRFLTMRLADRGPDKLIVVENWFEELKAKSAK